MPASMNISLPETMKDFVDEQVQGGGYGSASEDIGTWYGAIKSNGRKRAWKVCCWKAWIAAKTFRPRRNSGRIYARI